MQISDRSCERVEEASHNAASRTFKAVETMQEHHQNTLEPQVSRALDSIQLLPKVNSGELLS